MTTFNVLHIGKYYYPRYGGMESYLYNLCEDLSKKIKVDILVSNNEFGSLSLNLNGLKVDKAGTWYEFASTPISPSMITQLRGRKYDIIHLHLPNPMANLAYHLTKPTGKLIVTWHNDIVRQRILKYYYNPFQTMLLEKSEKIIVTSQKYLDSSKPLSPYRKKCEIIPIGIDFEQFRLTDKIKREVTELRSKYKNIIYYVGRLVPYKGVNYLVNAMKDINGTLFIASKGPLIHKLKSMTKDLELEKKIFFLGELDAHKLLTFYHACDVFCLPSINRSEAFGIVQLEAMACGKPVVSTTINTGVSEVNIHKKTGLSVPPENSAELSHAINFLLENKDIRNTYGNYAQQWVNQNYKKEFMSEKTFELYKDVLDG